MHVLLWISRFVVVWVVFNMVHDLGKDLSILGTASFPPNGATAGSAIGSSTILEAVLLPPIRYSFSRVRLDP